MEEETIDEEEADTVHYETSSDEGYDEFEEETQAAGGSAQLNGDAREAVSEIHMASIAASGERIPPKLLLPKAKKIAKNSKLKRRRPKRKRCSMRKLAATVRSMLASEVRAPAATAGYTQRTQRPRPGHDRPGTTAWPRDRSAGGWWRWWRRFRRRENRLLFL